MWWLQYLGCQNIKNKAMVNNAQVVKLVDTLASGASARKSVEVQVLFWAPNAEITDLLIYSD